MRARCRHVGLLWPGLGLTGSLATTLAATGLLAHRPVSWWWSVSLGTHGVQWHVFWAGVVLLCVAWAGLGWRLHRRPGAEPAELVAVGALWAVPLVLGPALFSLDMYSYLAQGAVLAHGMNPYQTAPQALHDPALLAGVSSTWRHTTTPYGPVFIALASLAVRLAGTHVAVAVTLLRLPELLGMGLLAWSVPRLARFLGADPARAAWLAVISPLSLLYLVGGGHNDALMIGLMLAGVTLALERRPLAGIALCALAATVKLPGAAAVVMIAICWWRAEPARWRYIVTGGALVCGAAALAAGAVSGVGTSWISSSLFSTPATARMALTPATAVAVSLWELSHHFGAGVEQNAASWENAATLASAVLVAIVALFLSLRVRYATLPRYLGLLLIAAAIGGPIAWPWYLSWGIVLLATDRRVQSSVWLPVILIAAVFPIMAGGQVAVPLPDAWWTVVVYGAAAAVAVFGPRMRRSGDGQPIPAGGPGPATGSAPIPRTERQAPAAQPPAIVSTLGHVPGESSSILTSDVTG